MDTMLSWGRVGLLFCILQQVSYIESAVHRDVDILLAWKATLREGHCLGCRDGPVLRNWTREKGICEWWDLIPVAGVDDLQQRGVTRCSDPNQQVHKVDLSNMELTGKLPGDFQAMQWIADLCLEHNQFTGTLPESWSAIGSLASDVELKLSGNALVGTLPSRWGTHTGLKTIDLADNQLSGPLPRQWSSLLSLHSLNADGNTLTGPLPAEWGWLSSLKRLGLARNRLTGPLPLSWSAMNVYRLEASSNGLSGTIPNEWTQLHEITQLLLGDNKLTGTLPRGMSHLAAVPPMLSALDVSENRMEIFGDWYPQSWEVHPQQKEPATFQAANLLAWKASLPGGSCLGCASGPVLRNFTSDQSVCDWNAWISVPGKSGPQHRGVTRCRRDDQMIVKLDLSDMGLSGPLPPSLGAQEHMTDLYLENNRFSGTLPAEWANMGILSSDLEIKLDGNEISGTLPASWSGHPSLARLNAGRNKLAGLLPPRWSEMEQLASVQLPGNQLSGGLPEAWSSLQAMRKIDLHGNRLHGSLPGPWAAWRHLTSMDLSGNQFTGSVPGQWILLDRVEMDLSDNLLTGPQAWFPDIWTVLPRQSQNNDRHDDATADAPLNASAIPIEPLISAAANETEKGLEVRDPESAGTSDGSPPINGQGRPQEGTDLKPHNAGMITAMAIGIALISAGAVGAASCLCREKRAGELGSGWGSCSAPSSGYETTSGEVALGEILLEAKVHY